LSGAQTTMFNHFMMVHAQSVNINWSSMVVKALLDPLCLTCDWSGLSDLLEKALVETCLTNFCSNMAS
jgi:hypothetical protein